MTKKKHRALEALRRLGGELPPPDPNFRCRGADRYFGIVDRCSKPPVRFRESWDGTKAWYCIDHDPVRRFHEERNRKKREEEKRRRWKTMERDRKPS